jgi:regulator of RNase E activity RraA
VGTGAEAKPHAVQVPLNLDGTLVKPGDIVFCDDINGVVVIPHEKLPEVLSLLPRMTAADQNVEEDVAKGMTVKEAFTKHRPVILQQ